MTNWIIVVDDDTANLKVAGHILSNNKMRVTAFKTGQSLLDYVNQNGYPDLVLLDIRMPGLDGFETYKLFREGESRNQVSPTPVIFLTADEDPVTERKGFEIGVSDFIRKPFDPNVLIKRINNIIDKNRVVKTLQSEVSKDPLTGLLNKSSTEEKMTEICSDKTGFLFMIDLDSFKLVNDIYGHKMGDDILIAFKDILLEEFKEGSIVGRVGGDEFCAFSSTIKNEEDIAKLCDDLNYKISERAKIILGEEMNIPLGVSLGCVIVPKYGNDFKALLNLADKSLLNAKKNGKHGYELYQVQSFEKKDGGNLNIYEISEILGERNIPDVALQLDKDSFSYVYRYVMREIIRNRRSACKILFTLNEGENSSNEEFGEFCDDFGNHIISSLRKSDILMRNCHNQYFVFLTDIKPEAVEKVINHIIGDWVEKHEGKVSVSTEHEVLFKNGAGAKIDTDFRVVVVDDDAINLKVAGKVLGEAGIRTISIKSGIDLLTFLKNDIPDLILMDVKMPEMDGYETLKRVRELDGNAAFCPVIFLTGDDSLEAESRGLSLGAMDFIKKPFVPEVLSLRVRHSLELIRLQKNLSIEVENKTAENRSLFVHVVKSIADAIDSKDKYTNGHSSWVAEYSREISKRAGFSTLE